MCIEMAIHFSSHIAKTSLARTFEKQVRSDLKVKILEASQEVLNENSSFYLCNRGKTNSRSRHVCSFVRL